MFEAYMITYLRSDIRRNNFYNTKQKLTSLNLFEAIDFCSDAKHLSDLASELFSRKFWDNKLSCGKVGFCMSHYLLYKQPRSNWVLVLEDDNELKPNFNLEILEKVIVEAEKAGSVLVFMDTRNKFKSEQFAEKNRISTHLYGMIPQWGSGAYLINSEGRDQLLSLTPLDSPLDMHYFFWNLSKIDRPTVIADKHNPFVNMGVDDYKSRTTTKYGSLLEKKVTLL